MVNVRNSRNCVCIHGYAAQDQTQTNLFELLLALSILSFLRLQQGGQLLLLLGQYVLLELFLLSQDCLRLVQNTCSLIREL